MLISFIEDCFVIICLIFNNKYTKNNPLLGLLLKLFLRKKKNCLSRIGVIKSNNKRRRQKQPQQENKRLILQLEDNCQLTMQLRKEHDKPCWAQQRNLSKKNEIKKPKLSTNSRTLQIPKLGILFPRLGIFFLNVQEFYFQAQKKTGISLQFEE